MPIPFVNTLAIIGSAFILSTTANTGPAITATSANTQPNPSLTSVETATGGSFQNDSITRLADKGRVQGNESAKVWVIEISDMQCPYCKEWNQKVYPQLYDEFIKTGKIRFAYINFPLTMHSHARDAARSAMCASVQGKFWEMKKSIFDSQDKWSSMKDAKSFFEGLAKDTGVDMDAWKSCLDSKSVNAVIDADVRKAKAQNVRSTPSLLIANRLVSGAVPMEDLRKMINAALGESK